MRRRLSYANVAASLALLFSMSGGALAASHYLINSTKQINPKVLRKLEGKSGATGGAGSPGSQGPKGERGEKGEKGEPGLKGNEGNSASIPALPAITSFESSDFSSGWSNYGLPQPAGYYKDALGIVHLTGAVKAASSSSIPGYVVKLEALPPGYRGDGFFSAGSGTSGSAACTLSVDGGGIYAESGCNYQAIELEGITFRPYE